MRTPRILLRISLVAGLISLAAFILGRLAMTDIHHGEPDLTLEWNVVSATFLPVLLFHLFALIAMLTALRALARTGDQWTSDCS